MKQLSITRVMTITRRHLYSKGWAYNLIWMWLARGGGVPWLPAKKTYTVIDNGLDQPWEGRVWCNPPFSNTAPFSLKMLGHGNGILLVPMSKSKWFDMTWRDADGVLVLPSSMKFMRRSGEEKHIFMPCVLFAFGTDNLAALKSSGLGHVR